METIGIIEDDELLGQALAIALRKEGYETLSAVNCREGRGLLEKNPDLLLIDINLPDGEFDPMLGLSTGASVIFGATGGVMEAALRTVAAKLLGDADAPLEFHDVRGIQEIKEASYELPGRTVKVCVASGLSNAKIVLDGLKSGELDYDFIEFMACPGGCVNGGGQPSQPADVRNFTDLKGLRAKALYDEDEGMTLRKSHDNPLVKQVYEEYLGKPGSEKAHKILHTSYVVRGYEY